jgi:hypothetical protein
MLQYWISPTTERIYQTDPPTDRTTLTVHAPRGGTCSFQVHVRTTGALRASWIDATARVKTDLGVRVRRIGYVPVPHHNTDTPQDELDHSGSIPGFVPDPLFPDTRQLAAPDLAYGYWITVDVPRSASPGTSTVEVGIIFDDASEPAATVSADIRISSVAVEPRRDFPVTHWFYTDALCDWYGVEPFEEAFWPICERYLRNYAAHGLDTIYVPALTPSLDGEKRPTQLLRITPGKNGGYRFDWRDVKRFVDLAKACGISRFEWPHLFTQWGVERAILVYRKSRGADEPLWPRTTGATSETYREFLAQYLPSLKRFLDTEGIVESSFFHVSDEPHENHLSNYRNARAMLKELAPWMLVMDALSNIEFARDGLTDMPIPSISTALQFKEAGIPSWAYFCCGPRGRYTNRLLDTPLAKIRAIGWLLYRHRFLGFLHWGYNYWYKSQTRDLIDPYVVTDGLKWPGWAHGDTFVVYPGPDGPIDSIRWEVFAESLQDYALLQTLRIDPDDRMLEELRTFEEFPRDPAWIPLQVTRLLARDAQAGPGIHA